MQFAQDREIYHMLGWSDAARFGWHPAQRAAFNKVVYDLLHGAC